MPRRLMPMVGALFCSSIAVFAETNANTALGALKLLPKAAASKVALIEAHEGKPTPERWHILVHDPKEENGLHEYVVANGEIVASRALSQFAESLTAEDVIGEPVKVDSDRAAKLAQQYAEANSMDIAEMNFELKREGDGAAPLWKITCLDPEGNELGHLIVTATKGTIVSHDGFPIDPPPPKPAPEAQVVHAEPIADKKLAPKKPEIRRAEPVSLATPEPRPGILQRAGGTFQHIFTGR